jgi:hypothetical protein
VVLLALGFPARAARSLQQAQCTFATCFVADGTAQYCCPQDFQCSSSAALTCQTVGGGASPVQNGFPPGGPPSATPAPTPSQTTPGETTGAPVPTTGAPTGPPVTGAPGTTGAPGVTGAPGENGSRPLVLWCLLNSHFGTAACSHSLLVDNGFYLDLLFRKRMNKQMETRISRGPVEVIPDCPESGLTRTELRPPCIVRTTAS